MNEEMRLRSWTTILAKEYGGRRIVIPEGIRLESGSDKWQQTTGSSKPIILMCDPQTTDDWRERLRHCEKRAAQAVISGPVGFSCSATERHRTTKSIDAKIVRFAFGLSLSVGQSCYQRYTAYYASCSKQPFYVAGQDQLFSRSQDIRRLDLNEKFILKALPQLGSIVGNVENDYRTSSVVQAESSKLNAALTRELRELDRLYTAGYGQYALLLGKAPEGLRGDDAIEAEYFSKMDQILRRFTVAIVLKPLSLGLVSCKVRIVKKGKIRKVVLPFVEGSF